jgi:isoquinoline 1-oxidoreductase alpha subunit
MQLTINSDTIDLDVDPAMPLLWALRDVAGLKGTKFGCGVASCGACMVIVDGVATFSCVTAVGDVEGEVRTIEGLAKDGVLHPVQKAWVEEQVPQCGYCQSGQIMAAVALLEDNPQPTDADIDSAMSGNLCRCGTYSRIRAAIKRAASAMPLPADEPAASET